MVGFRLMGMEEKSPDKIMKLAQDIIKFLDEKDVEIPLALAAMGIVITGCYKAAGDEIPPFKEWIKAVESTMETAFSVHPDNIN